MGNPIFRAQQTPRPKGARIGWVATEPNGRRDFVKHPSTSMRDSLWRSGKYESVRGLFKSGRNYSIEV